ncbi:MAG: hypothetical protein KF886_02415 [Candidatus Hydrogenedentes bacterium]|nr:hypothetical protein [Candidatus Hydrogenedentota bacterium]
MKGRTFETFEVTAGNREAFDYCRRIALMEDMGPSLALLLGPESAGKSHLLWSIAKQVRLSAIPAGLALITPQEFPEKVRALADDPRPLLGRRAVLLVDNLEGFEKEAARLEALVETFLKYQHPVLIASNVHPNRLRELSGPLRARFARSRCIVLEPRAPAGEDPIAVFERIQGLEQTIFGLEQERDAISEKLAVALASAEDLARETVAMEGRVRQLQEEADFAMAQQARAQIALSEARFEQEENAGLRGRLATAEKAREQADARAAEALERLESLRAAQADRDEALRAGTAALAESLDSPETAGALRDAAAESARDSENARAALAATRDRMKRIEFELEKTRKMLAIQTAEMDALRYAAASQVATANVQAGEVEHLLGALDAALGQAEAAAADLGDEHAPSRTLRAAIGHMRAQMNALQQLRDGRASESEDRNQPSLFDTEYFEALPDDFDALRHTPQFQLGDADNPAGDGARDTDTTPGDNASDTASDTATPVCDDAGDTDIPVCDDARDTATLVGPIEDSDPRHDPATAPEEGGPT